MSIPKIIHYCWFGGNPLPKDAEKCIRSWKKYCPDYEIRCWNEENFDLSCNRYAYEAYQQKKWAFVTDFVRLKVVYDHGGIYLDTDVELIRPLDPLTEQGGFLGYEQSGLVATGLGFGAGKGDPLVKAMMDDYEGIPYVLPDGSFDRTPCPDRNTRALVRMGLRPGGEAQQLGSISFLPPEYLCPMNFYTGKVKITPNTYSIHHYSGSWLSATSRRTIFLKRLIGERMYNFLYGKFLHNFKGLEW